jgi:hypothetical protein
VDLWVGELPPAVAVHLADVADETLAVIAAGEPPPDAVRRTVALDAGPTLVALRRRAGDR